MLEVFYDHVQVIYSLKNETEERKKKALGENHADIFYDHFTGNKTA